MASHGSKLPQRETVERKLVGFTAEAGGVIPHSRAPAFTLLRPSVPAVPVLISVPHAGRLYPPALVERMRQPDATALMLEDRYVDRLAEEIALATGATLLIAEAPRAMLDLNRSPKDVDWGMVEHGKASAPLHSRSNHRARGGLGLVPRKLMHIGEIWKNKLTGTELEERIEGIHKPYHAAIQQVLAGFHERWGIALLLDLHSMPPITRQASQVPPARFVLGDRFGAACSAGLTSFALQQLGQGGRQVAHNLPYAGGYILERHAQPRCSIHAMQLEVCRSLYLDSAMRELVARYSAITRELASFTSALANEIGWYGRPLHQAAE